MPGKAKFERATSPRTKVPKAAVPRHELRDMASFGSGTPVEALSKALSNNEGENKENIDQRRPGNLLMEAKHHGQPTVVGRESEYKAMERQLHSFVNCGSSSILYITGVPGSGKTYTTISLLNHMGLAYCYINCSGLKKKSGIYRAIGRGLFCIKGNATLQSLRLHFNNCSEDHILVIDEIDLLWSKKETLLYNLFELPFFRDSKVFMVVISNTLSSLSTKVESRVGGNRMEFRPYSAKQLKRVVEAECQKDVCEKSIELITKRVAASTGDIRKVQEAVESVGHSDLSTVHGFLRDLTTPLISKFLVSFNFYQKMLVFLHKQPVKTIQEWFDSHKSFCIAKSYRPLDFADFMFVVNDLAEFGVYKIKKDGLEAVCNYIEEELDAAGKKDEDFIEFSKK